MAKIGITRASLKTARALRGRGETLTRPDAPIYDLDEEFWKDAQLVYPDAPKSSVRFEIDRDVLEWFRAQGADHEKRMNAVLRSFMEAHRQGAE